MKKGGDHNLLAISVKKTLFFFQRTNRATVDSRKQLKNSCQGATIDAVVIFLINSFLSGKFQKEMKNAPTKNIMASLDAPFRKLYCQDLSLLVGALVCWDINFYIGNPAGLLLLVNCVDQAFMRRLSVFVQLHMTL